MVDLGVMARALYADLEEGLAPLYGIDGTPVDIDEDCYYAITLPQGLSLKLNVYHMKCVSDLVEFLSPFEKEIEELGSHGYPVGLLIDIADAFAPEDQLPVLRTCIYLTDIKLAKRVAMRIGATKVEGVSLPFDVSLVEL